MNGEPSPTGVNSSSTQDHGDSLPNPDEIHRVESQTGNIKRQKMLQTIAGVAGNILEWYDFAAFGFFSDIIGDVFFPPQEGDAALIESFTVFGCAFIMRPVGGVIMGYIGDLYGRKKALEISIFLMAFPTFAMGCLPGYDRVGILSTILLILVRLVQGLSVGGQLVSSLVFTVESAPKEEWGLRGSLVFSSVNLGILLGNLVSFLLRHYLDEDSLYNWGWRIPFLSGILVSFCGIYLKYYCEEDTEELHHHHNVGDANSETSNPIVLALSKENIKTLVAATFVPILWCGGFYVSFVWMATYMAELIENPVPGAFGVNCLSLLCGVVLFFPIAGTLSDKYGRRRIMYCGGISTFLLSPILFFIITLGNRYAAFFAQTCLGVCLTLWGAPTSAWLVESFPAHIRLTSVAIGYNMAQATIGGASPALATYMVDAVGEVSPGFYISAMSLLSLIGLIISPPPRPQQTDHVMKHDNMASGDKRVNHCPEGNEHDKPFVFA